MPDRRRGRRRPGLTAEEVAANDDDLARAQVLSLEGAQDEPVRRDPGQHRARAPRQMVEHRERLTYLVEAVAELPERLRVVVEGYFLAERPMAEIADELGVTESRVSQMRAEALVLLKDAMNAQLDPELVAAPDRPDGCAARRREAYFAAVAARHAAGARRVRQPHAAAARPPPDRPARRDLATEVASWRRRRVEEEAPKSSQNFAQPGPTRADQARRRSPRTDSSSDLTIQEGIIMGLRINQNIDAFNSYRNLSVTQGQMSKSLEKLSSGFRINRAADDAAGLAISEGLRSQVGGLKVGVRNAQDGVSVVQTAEGALTEVHSMLQRMNDLAVQYNNGTQNTDSQAALAAEFDQLQDEITRITDNTKFNGVALFDGADLDLPGRLRQRRHDHRRPVPTPSRPSTPRPPSSPTAPRCRPRSPRSPPSAPTSVPSRTGSSTPSTTSTWRSRTCPRRRAGSATPTWRPRW